MAYTKDIWVVLGLTLLVIFAGAFIIYLFIGPSDAKISELFDDILGKTKSQGENYQERFKIYFEEIFLDEYSSCVLNPTKECWCVNEEFKIPNGFFIEAEQDGKVTHFNLLDGNRGNFVGYSYDFNIVSCILIEGKNFMLNDLKDKKLIIESGEKSYLSFESEQEVEISGENKKEFRNEADKNFLFYKLDENHICIVDLNRAKGLKDKPMC
jgi:hypothetical protein